MRDLRHCCPDTFLHRTSNSYIKHPTYYIPHHIVHRTSNIVHLKKTTSPITSYTVHLTSYIESHPFHFFVFTKSLTSVALRARLYMRNWSREPLNAFAQVSGP